jgi:nicotinamide-nucleotide amidase
LKAEIICIGTELLLGQIVNSNAAWISQELALIGIDCHFQTVVGDNKDRIKESLEIALNRVNIIITTGGLGPTSDDLTTETLAEFFDEEMILDQEVLEKIEKLFLSRNLSMPETNQKQALRPKSAEILPNPSGTAPGIIWNVLELWHLKNNIPKSENELKLPPHGNPYKGEFQEHLKKEKLIMTFPGVPRELHEMWKEIAFPFLSTKLAGEKKLFFKEIKFYGIGESALAEKVQDLLDLTDPTVAPLAGNAECRLRIATKANNLQDAEIKLKEIENKIGERVGEFIYGYDSDSLESIVGNILKQKQKTLAVAESCTGGLISERLTNISGSSAYIKLNVVTYSNESKNQILNVKNESLAKYGAVSEQIALEMAQGVRDLAGSDYGLSITGIAGPGGGSIEKPIGTVFIAFVGDGFQEITKLNLGILNKNNSDKNRLDIKWKSSQEALNLVRKILLKIN